MLDEAQTTEECTLPEFAFEPGFDQCPNPLTLTTEVRSRNGSSPIVISYRLPWCWVVNGR
jgi:hypothetical protein